MENFKWTAACLLAAALLAFVAGCDDDGNPGPQVGFVNVDAMGAYGDASGFVDVGSGQDASDDGSTEVGGDADSASTEDPCAGQPDGAACDDDDACTKGDACLAGTCSGQAVDCDDKNVCTTDMCDTDEGCTHEQYVQCEDKNSCTSDVCDPKMGCMHQQLGQGAGCDDGNECTSGDTCSDGTCVGGPAPSCNDSNVCTTDTCNKNGCQHAPLSGGTCDDGDLGTTGDTCNAGICVGAAPSCDDKNACTIDAGDGVGVPCAHSPLACDDGKVCTTDTCDPSKGCVFKNNAAPCDDGDACTVGEKCSAGFCAGGVAPVCNDSNPCTSDACDPAKGCAFVVLTGAACNDGNTCTTNDQCNSAGTCKGGPVNSCNDGNVCTTDTCDPAAGCLHSPLSGGACNDGDSGTVNDTCQAGKCSGSSVACDDGNACTVDGGNAPNCTYALKVCDDKNPCTNDTCSPTTGCVATPNTAACDDGNKCTANDVCGNGSCSGSAVTCNDANPCTTDACAPATGACVSTVVIMANGKPCGVGEVCGNGVDDDGDLLVDCGDKECGAKTGGPALCFDAQYDGASITVYAADKPGVEQKAEIPTSGQCFQFYCGEGPLMVTVYNTVNQGGWLKAWATDPGVVTEEKPVTKTSYWAFSVTESGFPAGTKFPQMEYTQPNGYAFTIAWPYK